VFDSRLWTQSWTIKVFLLSHKSKCQGINSHWLSADCLLHIEGGLLDLWWGYVCVCIYEEEIIQTVRVCDRLKIVQNKIIDKCRFQRYKGRMPRWTVYNLVSALRLRPVQNPWSKPFSSLSLLHVFPHFSMWKHGTGLFPSLLSVLPSSTCLNSDWQFSTSGVSFLCRYRCICFLCQWFFMPWHIVTACGSYFHWIFLPWGIKKHIIQMFAFNGTPCNH